MTRLNVDMDALGEPIDPRSISALTSDDGVETPATSSNPYGAIGLYGNHSSVGVDHEWSDLDIEEVIKSFSFFPEHSGGIISPAHAVDSCYEQGFQDTDVFPSFDALFGLE